MAEDPVRVRCCCCGIVKKYDNPPPQTAAPKPTCGTSELVWVIPDTSPRNNRRGGEARVLRHHFDTNMNEYNDLSYIMGHHHRNQSHARVWSAQIGHRAFRKGHGACLSRQAWICDLEAWSQPWACEEPVSGVGAQIIPSSSPSVICRGLECIDRSQSLPQRPWSVPFQAGLDLSLGRLEPVRGV